jgi:tetratricopeptide (TPR) repeat protein
MLVRVGRCLRMLKKYDEAQPYYEQAHAILTKAFEAHPESLGLAIELMMTDNSLASLHISKTTPEDDKLAGQWLAEGEKVYSKFAYLKAAEGRKLDLDKAKEAIEANKQLLVRRAQAATTQKS